MKDKIQLTFAALTLSAGLLLTVVAQGPGKYEPVTPKPGFGFKVPLTCSQAGSGDVQARVKVINNTRETVKQGTVIHFATNGGVKGTKTLTTDLVPGTHVMMSQADVTPYTCQAHYIKY
jgi:hypothetical protein